MTTEPFSEEAYCRMAIARLQREYYEAIKPYVDRLVTIESLHVRPNTIPMMDITPDLIEQLGARK